ncbi:Na+/H+ antiporter NhaC family protein [Amphibacillus cookii]|uniref:Na+/H+ antiporter NhaC family protein n=1 Tax=Amphibacillus cookii TaxID=767787 RepID=UPI00195AB358|nr:Na+/H+ antiporter NhaC family protein [Amphibacillus cookii]MBM7542119.1 putative histidine transporter YuiF (NhaC family) [Amphibacillus cookii]
MEWIVIISVLSLLLLSLLRVHVLIALLISSVIAGLLANLSIVEAILLVIDGMGEQSSTALSYIILGGFAVAISYTGITTILVRYLIDFMSGKRVIMVLFIAGIASLSQNLVPVHIAFIPLLIPPLLKLFDQMKLDRRAVATALTFGLKAPYVTIPAGYGLLFHQTIQSGMATNGLAISIGDIAKSLALPGLGMVFGLLFAVFISYRKPIEIEEEDNVSADDQKQSSPRFNRKHALTLIAILAALIVQILTETLVIGALTGLILMFIFLIVPFREGDRVMTEGIKMMGTIAFVMLVAAGFGHLLQEVGAITAFVEMTETMLGTNQALIAIVLLLVGLLITLGMGSSFATVPILAALYVPIGLAAGFSSIAIAALIGTSAALGDAGSPASDSTLGPTSGLNADGKHDHIWGTCVPTFIHFNIPLIIFGWLAALIL